MKKLEIIIRPDKLELLKSILDESGCQGITILAVKGFGVQKDHLTKEELHGMDVNINLLPKIQVNVVIQDELLDSMLLNIYDKVSTGNVGDGKVIVYDVFDAMRIRTGERGTEAI